MLKKEQEMIKEQIRVTEETKKGFESHLYAVLETQRQEAEETLSTQLKAQVRTAVRTGRASVRTVRTGVRAVRTDVRTDVRTVRADVRTVRTGVRTVRADVRIGVT